jgi:hypothetical protein
MSHRHLNDHETFQAGRACGKTVTKLHIDGRHHGEEGKIFAVTNAALAIAFDAYTGCNLANRGIFQDGFELGRSDAITEYIDAMRRDDTAGRDIMDAASHTARAS